MDGRPVDFLCPPEDVQKGKEDHQLRMLDWYFISVDMYKQKVADPCCRCDVRCDGECGDIR